MQKLRKIAADSQMKKLPRVRRSVNKTSSLMAYFRVYTKDIPAVLLKQKISTGIHQSEDTFRHNFQTLGALTPYRRDNSLTFANY